MIFHFPSILTHFLVFIKIYFQSHTKMCIILFHWKQNMNVSSSGMILQFHLFVFSAHYSIGRKHSSVFVGKSISVLGGCQYCSYMNCIFLNSAVNIRALLLRYSSFFSFIKLHTSWLKRERMFGNVPYVN